MNRTQQRINVRRVYEQPKHDDGARFLVERLWPRGISKNVLHLDAWLKDVAPSAPLRRWFAHDPARWQEFRRRYFEELRRNPSALRPILTAARRHRVTLLYSARDTTHNNAVALSDYITARLDD
jgi:uncharacterized protein YeaO (DUF488 family)